MVRRWRLIGYFPILYSPFFTLPPSRLSPFVRVGGVLCRAMRIGEQGIYSTPRGVEHMLGYSICIAVRCSPAPVAPRSRPGGLLCTKRAVLSLIILSGVHRRIYHWNNTSLSQSAASLAPVASFPAPFASRDFSAGRSSTVAIGFMFHTSWNINPLPFLLLRRGYPCPCPSFASRGFAKKTRKLVYKSLFKCVIPAGVQSVRVPGDSVVPGRRGRQR
jgi:hypothetical protein